MPDNNVPGTVECRIFGQLFGQQVINRIYFTNDGLTAPTLLDVANLAGFVDETWDTWVVERLSEDYAYTRVIAKSLHSSPDWQARSGAFSGPGGIESPSEPGNVAIRLNFDAGVGGKSAHWGIQVSGIPKVNQTGNTLAVDYATSLAGAMGNFLTVGAVVTGYNWTVVNRVANKVVLPVPQTYQVQQCTLNDYNLDSQKTRLNGRGR